MKTENDNNFAQEVNEAKFTDEYNKAFKRMYHRPNILVCGYTGSGKSSLINAILGDEIVSRDKIGEGKPKTQGFEEFSNDLVCVYDSKGMENGEREDDFVNITREFVRDKQNSGNAEDNIHIVWYVIQGSGARVTDCDKNLINKVFNPNNLIVVVTKADITRATQREALKKEVMSAGIPEERIIFTSDKEGGCEGCDELMKLTLSMLPNAYRDAFMEQQEINMEVKRQAIEEKEVKAKGIIATATAAAASVALSPIPFSDAAIIVPTQLTMIASLAALYGVRGECLKAQVMPFVARMAGTFLAGNLIKFIPGLGSIAGAGLNAAIASSITGAIGFYTKSLFKKSALAKIEGREMPELAFNPELFEEFRNLWKKENAKA